MLWCFAHAKDARVFGVAKLILFKEVHTSQASRVWAMSSLIFKSTSATFPGQHYLTGASHHLLLPEISPGELGTFFQRVNSVSHSHGPFGSYK